MNTWQSVTAVGAALAMGALLLFVGQKRMPMLIPTPIETQQTVEPQKKGGTAVPEPEKKNITPDSLAKLAELAKQVKADLELEKVSSKAEIEKHAAKLIQEILHETNKVQDPKVRAELAALVGNLVNLKNDISKLKDDTKGISNDAQEKIAQAKKDLEAINGKIAEAIQKGVSQAEAEAKAAATKILAENEYAAGKKRVDALMAQYQLDENNWLQGLRSRQSLLTDEFVSRGVDQSTFTKMQTDFGNWYAGEKKKSDDRVAERRKALIKPLEDQKLLKQLE